MYSLDKSWSCYKKLYSIVNLAGTSAQKEYVVN